MAAHAGIASLLDRAKAEAKRAGHALVTPWHLAQVLATMDPERMGKALGPEGRSKVAESLGALPRAFGAVTVSAPLAALLESCAQQPAPMDAIWDRLPAALADVPASATPAPAGKGDGADLPASAAASTFRPALQTMVELLLEQSLQSAANNRLLGAVLGEAAPSDRVRAFAQFVFTASPVVVIESEHPFVEGVIHQVLVSRSAPPRELNVLRAGVSANGDAEYVQVQVPEQGRFVVLLPLHGGQTLLETARVVHELAAREVTALIGCERFAQLPEPLRRLTDVRLALPVLDAATFVRLFAAIFGEEPSTGWDAGGAQWVRHVQHFDFEQPQRLALAPADALHFIRDKVDERLRAVEATHARGIDQLHGLGEAGQFARDLIREIAEAMAGRMAWQDVDRGVLLAGPPGTGKTSLARAIAKDCGVKFINASVAGWQAAGHLGDHIRAIRATFAEARRYAPSILFLDEIDGLGSRHQLSGPGAQYQTEVINAVLEQMQGLDPTAPVFVIAATNNPGGVDPALRRPGRLDRVIEIPYPSSEALSAMFSDYLDAQRDKVGLDPLGIDVALLGRMAFGLTGADVDQLVRGAARRARRAGRAIATEDLIAEITRKPREGTVSRRLQPAEVERVAVHEAGHALARYVGSTRGKDIGFVSVVPRSDGSLGFVALAPDDRVLLTKREYHEFLAVALAGRAAEELKYGPDGISGGCSNDLASATTTALRMITRSGLGPQGRLISTDRPAPEHLQEAEALLSKTYASTLETLRNHREALERLAATLVARQELTAAEVLATLAGP